MPPVRGAPAAGPASGAAREHPARVLIVGQAPGTKVHATGIPFNDPSGDKLREWLDVDRDTFYDESRFAIVPTGLCYPGKGPSGDAPPRPECAPLWHPRLRAAMPQLELTVLIGSYAQAYYLGDRRRRTWPRRSRRGATICPASCRRRTRARATAAGSGSTRGSRTRWCRNCASAFTRSFPDSRVHALIG